MQRSSIQSTCDDIAKAQTAPGVLVLANEYLGRLPAEHVRLLPAACKPRSLQAVEDVSAYAYDLRSHPSLGGSESAVVQMQVAAVIACAAHRLAELHAKRRTAPRDS